MIDVKWWSVESEIQRAICDYLTLRKVFFFRCNNQPIYDATRKGFRALPKYTMKGISDIIALKDGHAYFIEVKAARGRVSPEQHEFGKNIQAAGGTYIIARAIEDVRAIGL